MPSGGQKGSANAFKYGAYALLAIRTKGRPNGNTKLGRAFRAQELQYMRDMGGEETLSLAQRQIAADNVWCDLLIATMDNELATKKRLTRKGKPHPLIDLRIRIASHRRENFKLVGLKRVEKAVDWRSVLRDSAGTEGNDPDSQQGYTSQTAYTPTQNGNGSEDSPNEMAQIASVKDPPDTGVSISDGTGEGTGKDSQ
jgi:hypothetical protein